MPDEVTPDPTSTIPESAHPSCMTPTTPQPPPPAPDPSSSSSGSPTPTRAAYLIGNLIRLGGLTVALNEALVRSEARPSALAVAAFMLAGAQGVDTFLDRLFGGPR